MYSKVRKSITWIVIVGIIVVSLCACNVSDVTDQVTDAVQQENENIIAVKNGSPTTYPDKTYGEVFENFFGSPTWKYFTGSQDGPDEDGDGQPDYVNENIDIVEFTGYCTYQDVKVKALIQFTLSSEDNTFEATYLSFNDVPQSSLIMYALLEKAFSEGGENEQEVVTEAPVVTEKPIVTAQAAEEEAVTAENTISENQYIFPDSNSTYYNEQALYDNHDYETLWYGKNEIYARHGYIFQNQELNAYFSNQEWYNGTVEGSQFDEAVLNDYEKANIQVFQNVLDFYNR